VRPLACACVYRPLGSPIQGTVIARQVLTQPVPSRFPAPVHGPAGTSELGFNLSKTPDTIRGSAALDALPPVG